MAFGRKKKDEAPMPLPPSPEPVAPRSVEAPPGSPVGPPVHAHAFLNLSDGSAGPPALKACLECGDGLPAQCCARCRFWQIVPGRAYDQPDGRCRRYPDHHQPHTGPAEWCGEWARSALEQAAGG